MTFFSTVLNLTMAFKLPGARLAQKAKRAPFSFKVKISIAVILGLSFAVIWSVFSYPTASTSVSSRRNSFDDIEPPFLKGHPHLIITANHPPPRLPPPAPSPPPPVGNKTKSESEDLTPVKEKEKEKEKEEEEDVDIEDGVVVNSEEEEETDDNHKQNKKLKNLGPLFDSKAQYEWKLCGGKIKHNFVPCVDMEQAAVRHHERSCPRHPLTCLVPLPQGYVTPIVPWPESQFKIFYRNIAHTKLSVYVKKKSWLNFTEEYLMISQEESEIKGSIDHYLSSIEEMVPDIEWGKNIRVVLDIGCKDGSFAAALLQKDVITLSLGLMSDQADLAQLTLERGIPAIVGSMGTRRLPFPSGVFDVIHCSDCNIHWHSNGGRLLLEMNRILRPGGYFIISTSHGDVDREEGLAALTVSICWNILAHKTDEVTEMSAKIFQKPTSNDIYELRRRKQPPLCKENENEEFAWYTPITTCLHKVPSAIEERGTDWPEEWPRRLEAFPEWLGDSVEKIHADDKHWKAIIERSYLNGMGIDWSNIRNVMDMKAIYGGFAAALASQKVWVMNVVPVHAPKTLPVVYERGLVGIYHDWCEPFSTYPRTYDLLHADHLFSRLKNRCKHPIVIVVEMDRILRPGGWAIIREKLEILNPLESIFRSLHWDIRMTFGKDREGIMCVQKTTWRPQAI